MIPVPYYNISSIPGGENDLDIQISSYINDAIQKILLIDKKALKDRNSTDEEKGVVYKNVGIALENMPHGAIYFKYLNHSTKSYSFNYHIGKDIRLSSSLPSAGIRLLTQQTQLDNGILRNSNITLLGNAQITQGLRLLPQYTTTAILVSVGGLVGQVLYPFGVSFLLPIFAIILVQEKEQRMLVMMKMNGMKEWAYYLSHYVVFYILYCISSIIFYISGYVAKLTMFTLTDVSVLALLFFLWGI